MKEIKAFVRQHRIADVLQALRDSAQCDLNSGGIVCHNLTVSQVYRPFAGADPSQQRYSMELAAAVVTEHKLELVCADEAAEALIDVISQAAHTGQPEAGWVFVSDVQHAVEIR
jgi:nitrogen regulatory protein P-II 1